MRGPILRFVLALVATLTIGLLLVAVNRLPPTQPNSTPPATSGYSVFLTPIGGNPSTIDIGPDGSGCAAMQASDLLNRVCRTATFTDGPLIAEQAYGHLNVAYTVSFEAIVWRARLDRLEGFCAASGLLGDWLSKCQTEAIQSAYEITDNGLTVQVPLGPTGPQTAPPTQ
jgi:hypothetical protein